VEIFNEMGITQKCLILKAALFPGVYSASNREFWGVEADNLTAICGPILQRVFNP
jgi:hypothetical protein